MRFVGLGPTRGRMPAGGDGIVREAAPAAARLSSLSSANYFVSAAGAGGPDLSAGKTLIVRVWNTTPTGDQVFYSYGDGTSGYFLDMKASYLQLALRNPTSVFYSLDYNPTFGLVTIAITRLAGGAIRYSVNGGAAVQLVASPTYVTAGASSVEHVGRSHATVGSFSSPLCHPVEIAYLTREASDSELVAWSSNTQTDRYHCPASVTGDASLAHYRRAEDWNGSSSTWSAAVGGRTLTKAGTPVKTALPAETVYTIPAWAWHNSQLSNIITDRGAFARLVLSTTATNVAALMTDDGVLGQRELAAYSGGSFAGYAADPRGSKPNPQTIDFPNIGTGARTIELIEGSRTEAGSPGPYYGIGVTMSKIRIPSSEAVQFITEAGSGADANRVLVVGDSISVGIGTSHATTKSWIGVARANGCKITSDGWNGASLWSRTHQAAWLAASVARWSALLNGSVTNTVWFALGTNDWKLTVWAGDYNAFGAQVGVVLDAFHAARPDVTIYWQLPILSTADTGQPDYRTAAANACASRPWVTVVHGESWTIAMADTLHPSDAGCIAYEAYVRAILGY
jgi:hypothetical protein